MQLSRRFGVLAAALLSCQPGGAPGWAAEPVKADTPGTVPAGGGIFPFKLNAFVLENGVQVVLAPFDSPGLVSYFTLVRVGSRDEVEKGHTGFAHFFEHMMFRGTEKYPPGVRDGIVTAMGGDDNAFTGTDLTGYYVVAPADGLAKIVDVESDRFQHLKYGLEAFQTEARAVLGEYNKNRAIPERRMWEALFEKAYTAHTYKHTPIGFLPDIEAMPQRYEYSLSFFKRHYAPDNCTVLVVGDFDPAAAERLIREHYGRWQSRAKPPKVAIEPEQKGERRTHLDWPSRTLPRLLMGYKVPSFKENLEDLAALDVLSQYAFGSTSPLYQTLVLKEQTALDVGVTFELKRDPGLFLVGSRVEAPERLKVVERAVEQAIDDVRQKPIDAARLQSIRSNMRYDLLMGLNTGLGAARTLARFMALGCKPDKATGACVGDVESLNRYYAAIERVTAGDLQRVARTWLVPARRTVVTLSSGSEK